MPKEKARTLERGFGAAGDISELDVGHYGNQFV
jgi:hypothetical protein